MKDSHLRSFIKGVTWRITGTVDTMVLAYFITGHLGNAVKIGLAEVVTKIIFYYLHERCWNLIRWGRVTEGPSHVRSFVKGVTWRMTGTMDTIMLSFFITGHIENALKIGGSEVITKIFLYYCHERVWSLFSWGRLPIEPFTVETVKNPQPLSYNLNVLEIPAAATEEKSAVMAQ